MSKAGESQPANVPSERRCTMPTCPKPARSAGDTGLCESHHQMRLGESSERSEDGDAPLLDSNRESRTPPHEGDSSSANGERDSGADDDGENWSRQQKRTFHRVHTLLSYWEQHEYQVLWVTLTSSPSSDDAGRLAYNQRRLRQTIERARLAKDADGNAHRLDHVNELESLVIRTSEGPAGKGVLHLFWAWKPPSGHHSRDLFIPHDWLARQWGRIHGGDGLDLGGDVQGPIRPDCPRLHVWVESVDNDKEYESMQNLAAYCCSQYLGDHGEALENLSWSWERSLGGSVVNAWETIKSLTDATEKAIELWHDLLGGEGLTLSSNSKYVHYVKTIRPPPDLGVETTSEVDVTPPDDWTPNGPGAPPATYTLTCASADPRDSRECPECGSSHGLHLLPETHPDFESGVHGRKTVKCVACKFMFALPDDADVTVQSSRFAGRQTRFRDFTPESHYFDQYVG